MFKVCKAVINKKILEALETFFVLFLECEAK